MTQRQHSAAFTANAEVDGGHQAGARVTVQLLDLVTAADLWRRRLEGQEGRGRRGARGARGLQWRHWNGSRWGRLTGRGPLGRVTAFRELVCRRLAVALLEDVQALSQAAERGGRRGFEQQQVLVQAGQRPSGGERVYGVDQVLLLAFSLGHHLGDGQMQSFYSQKNKTISMKHFLNQWQGTICFQETV